MRSTSGGNQRGAFKGGAQALSLNDPFFRFEDRVFHQGAFDDVAGKGERFQKRNSSGEEHAEGPAKADEGGVEEKRFYKGQFEGEL